MHDIERLERHINEIYEIAKDLSDGNSKEELLKIIHRPGWTTPAEYELFLSLLHNTVSQAHMVQANMERLTEGGRAISEGEK